MQGIRIKRNLKSLRPRFWKYRYWLITGILWVTLANLFSVFQAQFVREAFDAVGSSSKIISKNNNPDFSDWVMHFRASLHQLASYKPALALLLIAGLIVLAALIRGVFMFLMRQALIVMSRFIEYDLKNDIYRKYQQLPFNFYRNQRTGDLMNRISEDVSRVRMYVGPAIMYLVNLLVMFLVVISSMVAVHPWLSVWVLAPLPILSISIYFVNNKINAASDQLQSALSDLTSEAQESFSGLRIIKAFGKETFFSMRFDQKSNQYYKKAMRLANIDSAWFPLIMLLIGLSSVITLVMGGYYAREGEITIGNIAEYLIYVNMLSFPVAMLGWLTSITQRASASMERINDFLHYPSVKDEGKVIEKIESDLSITNIYFTYPETKIKALNGVSIRIPLGQRVGLIGPTGSGKTTLLQLILRLLETDSGEIKLGELPIASVSPTSWRARIGYVPQDVFLFSDTIKNNLLFGLESKESMSDYERAITAAQVKEMLDHFQERENTLLGERGITLSGGQKQRVAIARALIKNPDIYIFDDCLSALDTETEQKVLQGILEFNPSAALLMISQRAYSLKNCDYIYVMKDGMIAEEGNHQTLIKLKGYYHDIWMKQQGENPL